MKWPVQCPDINPIENLWIDLKNYVFDAKPKSAEDLWSVVQSACSFCSQVSVDCMLHRCKAVIRNSSELKGKAKSSFHFQFILEIFQFVHESRHCYYFEQPNILN